MSKAIAGAAVLVGAGVALTVLTGGLSLEGLLALTATEMHALEGAALLGLSMEAGAVADALTSNRGMNITTRQPAAARQIIYGTQRVGGILVFESTTGGTHAQYNMVIVLAGHVCWAITDLYLDGRKVYWNGGSGGHSTRNGYGFGGTAAGGSYMGPDGSYYNFGGKVYCEARFGDQAVGDVISGLTANDPTWAARGGKSPYLGGCTYVYLKIEYDPNIFPQRPEARFTVMGKEVYDPRSGLTAYSDNNALIIADIITDSVFGLGDATVNTAQLIAAANVCAEQVTLAAGGTEDRYACHIHFDTSTAPSDALTTVLAGCAGRLSRIGGEWYIWPAYWQGPAFSFSRNDLTAEPTWVAKRSYKDLCNRVTGTYIASNYPYNVGGNLYDSNGFYDGTRSDTFNKAFQPTNFPEYAADTLHGYASDEWLAEDGGVPLPREVSFQSVLSVSQAQRLGKIMLFRNRQQGSGTFEMDLGALRTQPCDVMHFDFAEMGWSGKVLEIGGVALSIKTDSGAPTIRATMSVQETSSTVYDWDPVEELTVYARPALSSSLGRVPAPPTNVLLTSSAGTAVVQPDGSLLPRIKVTWDTPLDGLATQIEVQYQKVGDAAWTAGPFVAVTLNYAFISGVIAGQTYNVRIRSRRANGAVSDWVEDDGHTVALTINITGVDGLAPDSLIGEAFSGGGAAILCEPFTASVGSLTRTWTPTPDLDTGLAQGTRYYVYFDDPTFAGGAITTVATTNPADYRGVAGRYLIGSKVTPTTPTGGSGSTRYYASTFSDVGSRTSMNPPNAYDGDAATFAQVSASYVTLLGPPSSVRQTTGELIVGGFAHASSGATATLTVVAAGVGSLLVGEITANVNGTVSTMHSYSGPEAQATYTLSIPASTGFNTISIDVTAESDTDGGTGDLTTGSVNIYEIFIDT